MGSGSQGRLWKEVEPIWGLTGSRSPEQEKQTGAAFQWQDCGEESPEKCSYEGQGWVREGLAMGV